MSPGEPVAENPSQAEQPTPPAQTPDRPPPGETPAKADDDPRAGDQGGGFLLDLGEGVDEALRKLRDRASHYYRKSQHTRVCLKFRGKEVATIPLTTLVAAEAAGWALGAGWLRLLVANAIGRIFLDVEFINEADAAVAAGKERLLQGELDEALAKFREAATMDGDHPAAHLNLGVALKLQGRREEAAAAFEKAAALDRQGETGREARRQLERLKK